MHRAGRQTRTVRRLWEGNLKHPRLSSGALIVYLLLVISLTVNAQDAADSVGAGGGAYDTAQGASTVPGASIPQGTSTAPGEAPALPSEETLRFQVDDDAGDAPPPSGEVAAFGMWDLLRMVLVLLLVVGTIYGVVAFLRRRAPGGEEEPDSPIRVLATRALGANRELYAVMIGKSVYVLAGGDASMQLVTTIEEQETIDELMLAHSQARPREKTFGSLLSGVLANLAVPGSASDRAAREATAGETRRADGSAATLLRTQRDRLRQMR